MQTINEGISFFRLSSSVGALEVKVSLPNNKPFRGRVQVIDRKDGSYIINYRPVVPQKDVKLSIQHNGAHLASSPYVIKGNDIGLLIGLLLV